MVLINTVRAGHLLIVRQTWIDILLFGFALPTRIHNLPKVFEHDKNHKGYKHTKQYLEEFLRFPAIQKQGNSYRNNHSHGQQGWVTYGLTPSFWRHDLWSNVKELRIQLHSCLPCVPCMYQYKWLWTMVAEWLVTNFGSWVCTCTRYVSSYGLCKHDPYRFY